MSNPFGLPNAILVEREFRRRQRFRIGIYTVVVVATISLTGMLIQGCRTERPATAASSEEKPPGPGTDVAANDPATPPPVPPLEQSAEAHCVQPGSASLPDNITLPAPAARPAAHIVATHPPVPGNASHKITPRHDATTVYVVKSGDTLTRIAKTHGIRVRALKVLNHLKSDRIAVGEKLKLPSGHLAANAPVPRRPAGRQRSVLNRSSKIIPA